MKKMMFNDKFGLTQAVIQGQKTVTRRLISEKCLDKYYDYEDWANSVGVPEGMGITIQSLPQYMEHCNLFPYLVGEVVAVAQSYKNIIKQGKPEDCFMDLLFESYHLLDEDIKKLAAWNNKMFVKAELMPHQIKILSIRAERLQDITEDDCIKEGLGLAPYTTKEGVGKSFWLRVQGKYETCTTCGGANSRLTTIEAARKVFAILIDKISGKGTWEANPWVWRIEFELIKTK